MKRIKPSSKNSDKIITDLCGGTGSWSKPYVLAGYTVYIIDVKDGFDVRLFEIESDWNVYGILAAPDCTHFALSGARWWSGKGDKALIEGLSIVDACIRIITSYKLKGCLRFWALENPMGRLRNYLGEPKLKFQPCDYGDPYKKTNVVVG